jgi:hypothetical protein
MLRLSEAQWQALQRHDQRHFVRAACDQLLGQRPGLAHEPGSAEVLRRMQAAFDYAAAMQFTSAPHVIRLMHLAVDAPGIHDEPAVNSWLHKPGASREQRVDDLLALVAHRLKEAG